MDYKKGLRVKHPSVPEWGIGELLEDSSGGKARVFFVGRGETVLSIKDLDLVTVTGIDAEHPILDNLKITGDESLRYRTLPQSIQKFLVEFPGGFYGEKFAKEERDYKLKAHALMNEILSPEELKGLIDKQNYQELCRRALKIVNSTNLIFPNEKMSLKDGLKLESNQQRFSKVLRRLLFENSEIRQYFREFCEFLYEINAAKWTIASYFLFLRSPAQYVFLKPEPTKNCADICAYDIRYRPDLNWETYDAVRDFAHFLKDELTRAELNPRDMIDVQSFMWCIRPDKSLRGRGKTQSKKTDGAT